MVEGGQKRKKEKAMSKREKREIAIAKIRLGSKERVR